MAGENYVTRHGRFVRDPEKTTGGSGDKAWVKSSFAIAVNNAYPSDETSFYDCYAFGNLAERIIKYFAKGSEIVVHGEFQQEPYEGKDGKTKRPWKLRVQNFEFCGKKSDNQTSSVPDGMATNDDEVPF